jgi:hypothetical protein
MAVIQRAVIERPVLRRLTREEIDRRIARMWTEVVSAPGLLPEGAGQDSRPVWISTAELVRRMQPFLSDN